MLKEPGELQLRPRFITWSVWIILAIAIVFAMYVRGRLREFPLERDEGEFAYAGQLLLEGIPPYQLAYNMKLPGTYLAYAGLMAIFGQTTAGVHVGLLVVNLATIVLIFLMVRDIFDSFSAAVAALVYSILSASPSVLGMAAHATHYVAFFGVAGTWLLWRALQSGRAASVFTSGVLLGIAFLMKQQGVFLLCFGGLMLLLSCLWLNRRSWRKTLVLCALYAVGGILPYAATCLWLWHAGVFERFKFWTIDYASKYIEQLPLGLAIRDLFWPTVQGMIQPTWPLWLLALAGVVAVALSGKEKVGRRWFVYLYFLFSFLCVCPGFYFRQHYFIVLLPAVAVFAGAAAGAMLRLASAWHMPLPAVACSAQPPRSGNKRLKAKKALPANDPPPATRPALLVWPAVAVLALGVVYSIWQEKDFYFSWTPQQACRRIYGANPFVECPAVAEYLEKNTRPDQRIAVFGSEPELFFYAKRISATGYIYTYGLMEKHDYVLQMQQEMMDQIEAAKPEYLVFINISTSWLRRPDSEMMIFERSLKYLTSLYQVVGAIDNFSDGKMEYRWPEEAVRILRGLPYVSVWKRKS